MRAFLLTLAFLTLIPTVGAAGESTICHVCRVHEGEAEAEPVVATAEHDGLR